MCPDHRNTWPHLPPAFLTDDSENLPLENARVFSHHGVVIDAHNGLRADLSPDLRPHGGGHRILNYDRLPDVVKLESAAFLLASPSANKNYYHWLIESVPKLRHAAPEIPVLTPLARPFHLEALKAADIAPERWIELKNNSHFLVPLLFALPPVIMSTLDLAYLRSLFSAKNPPPPTRKIYISRRDSWRRSLRNEDELISFLEKNDFEIHALSGLSIRVQAALFSEATHLISPHGAALANLIFCHKSATILELFANNYVQSHYENIATLCGLNYHCHHSPTAPNDPGFEVDLPSFSAALANILGT